MAEIEEWRPVVGYEGLYEVSSLGRVRRLVVRHNTSSRPLAEPLLMKTKPRGAGYVGIDLSKGGHKWSTYVHVVVCEAFHGPKPPGKEVAHDDGVRAHNHEGNLRWDTPAGNHADKRRHGTHIEGERHPGHRLTTDQVVAILGDGRTTAAIAKDLGMSIGGVQEVRKRRSWKHV